MCTCPVCFCTKNRFKRLPCLRLEEGGGRHSFVVWRRTEKKRDFAAFPSTAEWMTANKTGGSVCAVFWLWTDRRGSRP